MTNATEQTIIKKLDVISQDISKIKTGIAVINARLDGQQKAVNKIPDLAEKVGELKNWRQIAIIIITGTASTILGWVLKGGRL